MILLTFSSWHEPVIDALVLQLHDDQTPDHEKRFARVTIPYEHLVRAFSYKDVFMRYTEELCKTFNKLGGKKVRIVNSTEYMEQRDIVPIMLPFHIGLVYYDA